MFSINGYDWNVMFVPSKHPMLHRADGTLTVGTTDLNSQCIYLSDKLRGSFLKKVFTHEVCHALMFSYSIFINRNAEEWVCDFVASHGEEIITTANDVFYEMAG